MNLVFWLPAMFFLGIVAMGLVLPVHESLRENIETMR